MPGRMAAAMITPRKTSAITILSFQSASAAATILITTSVATAVRFAVSPMTEDLCPSWRILQPRGYGERGGLHRRAAPRRRARGLLPARVRSRGAGSSGRRDRLAGDDPRRGAARRRGGDRAARRLAVGAHARRPDDGEALRRARDRAAACRCSPARARRPRGDRAGLARAAARVRDDRGRRSGDHARPPAGAHRRPTPVVIEVADLRKRYRKATAVDGLSFRVADGRITGFLGPNGAGKTTTLRILLGLVRPTAGRATIDGKAYRELADPIRRVGAVLEASNYHPKRTGRGHLRVMCTAAGLSWSRADELLECVGIAK